MIVFFASLLPLSCSKDKTRPIKSTSSYSSINESLNGQKGQTNQYAQTLAALENERQEIKDLRNSLQELKGTLGQNPDDLSLEEVEMISLVDSASELDEESMVKSAQSDIVEQLISSELNDPSSNITSPEASEAGDDGVEGEDTPEETENTVSEEDKKNQVLMYIGLAMTVSMGLYSGYKAMAAFNRKAYVGAAIGAGLMTSMFVIGALWAMDQDDQVKEQMLAAAIIIYGGLLVVKGMIMYTSSSVASKFVDTDLVEPVRKILVHFKKQNMFKVRKITFIFSVRECKSTY